MQYTYLKQKKEELWKIFTRQRQLYTKDTVKRQNIATLENK